MTTGMANQTEHVEPEEIKSASQNNGKETNVLEETKLTHKNTHDDAENEQPELSGLASESSSLSNEKVVTSEMMSGLKDKLNSVRQSSSDLFDKFSLMLTEIEDETSAAEGRAVKKESELIEQINSLHSRLKSQMEEWKVEEGKLKEYSKGLMIQNSKREREMREKVILLQTEMEELKKSNGTLKENIQEAQLKFQRAEISYAEDLEKAEAEKENDIERLKFMQKAELEKMNVMHGELHLKASDEHAAEVKKTMALFAEEITNKEKWQSEELQKAQLSYESKEKSLIHTINDLTGQVVKVKTEVKQRETENIREKVSLESNISSLVDQVAQFEKMFQQKMESAASKEKDLHDDLERSSKMERSLKTQLASSLANEKSLQQQLIKLETEMQYE